MDEIRFDVKREREREKRGKWAIKKFYEILNRSAERQLRLYAIARAAEKQAYSSTRDAKPGD